MKQRVITASVIIIVLAAAIIIGKYGCFALILIAALGASYEYYSLVKGNKSVSSLLLSLILSAAMVCFGAFLPNYSEYLMIFAVLILFIENMFNKEPDASSGALSVWGFIYISFFASLGLQIIFKEAGMYIIVTAIASCALCDTAAYFIGSAFGKHKLSPQISPNKSVEGAVAGFITAIIVFLIGLLFVKNVHFPNKTLFYALGGVVVGIFGQFGDLAASIVKRRYNVKDYGNIFPGHGGFLDRIDSYLFVFAGVYILYEIVVKLI